MPERLRDGVLCLGCFAAFADERLVEWDREIEFWPVSAVTMLTPEREPVPEFSYLP